MSRQVCASVLATFLVAAGCKRGQAPQIDDRAVARDAPMEFSGRVTALGPDDPPTSTLHLQRTIGERNTIWGRPASVALSGDAIWVVDPFLNKQISVWSLSTGARIAHFGEKGQGPEEYRYPTWVVPSTEDPMRAWIFDERHFRLTRVFVTGSNEARVEETITLQLPVQVRQPVPVGNHILFGTFSLDFTFGAADENGQNILWRATSDLPFRDPRQHDIVIQAAVNWRHLAVSPDRRNIAVTYALKARVDFFDGAGRLRGITVGPRSTPAPTGSFVGTDVKRVVWEPELRFAYLSASAATADFLYAVFCDCAASDGAVPTRLHVFDWAGNFVSELAFEHMVAEIAVSPDNHTLIGAVWDDDQPIVGVWHLPNDLARRAAQYRDDHK